MPNSSFLLHKLKFIPLKFIFLIYFSLFNSLNFSWAEIYTYYISGDSCNSLHCALNRALKNAKESTLIRDNQNITDTYGKNLLPLIILEQNGLTKVNSSQTLEINGHERGSLIIEGPNRYHVEFFSDGSIHEKVDYSHKKNHSSLQRSPKRSNPLIDNPIKIAIESLIFLDKKKNKYITINEVLSKNNKYSPPQQSNSKSPKKSPQILLIDENIFETPIYKENLQKFIDEGMISGPIYQDTLQELIDEGMISEAINQETLQQLINEGIIESPSIASVHYITQSGKQNSPPPPAVKDPAKPEIKKPDEKKPETSEKGRKIYIFRRPAAKNPNEDNSINLGNSKDQEDPNFLEEVKVLMYRLGYFKLILTLFGNKTQISLIDERLSLLVNDENPGTIAEYLDTVVMTPIDELVKKEILNSLDKPNATDLQKEINGKSRIVNKLNEDIEIIRDILINLPTQEALAAALNLMHPAKIADVDLILCNNHSLLYSNISRHFEEPRCCINPHTQCGVWGKAFGNFQTVRTEGYTTGYTNRTGGIFVGLDYKPLDTICLGSGFAFTNDHVKWHNAEADALLSTYYGFLYSAFNYEMCFLEAIGSLSYTRIDSSRYIRAGAALHRKASHENGALTFSGRLKGGLNFDLPCAIMLQVFGAVDLGNVRNQAFTEHGACGLNLYVHKRHSNHLRSEAGLQLSKQYVSNEDTCWTPTIAVKWVYQNPLSGNSVAANFHHQPSSFSVKTRNKITNQVSPVVSLTANRPDGIYFSAYYEGAFGDGWNSNEFGLHLGKSY